MTAFPELQVLGMYFVVRPSELSITSMSKEAKKRGSTKKKQGKMENSWRLYAFRKVTSKVPQKRPPNPI